jgi:tetratricopeptide (TPR) repeat protein
MDLRAFAAAAALTVALAPAVVLAQDQSLVFAQADWKEPATPEDAMDSKISADATELALLKDVFVHINQATRDRLSGRIDSVVVEDKLAADGLVSFLEKYKSHRLRIVFLRMAVVRYLNAKEWESAAEAAQRMIVDPKAQPVTKAIGARYASGAWQLVAVQEMRSGKIPQLKLQPSSARGGAAPTPRILDRPWRMFVENADIYERNRDADPTSKLTAEERKIQGGTDLGQLQLIAAQVEFGYDNIEDAQKRFAKMIDMHPSRIDLLETAVPFYLDTFRILKDPKGLEAAAARIEPAVAAEAKKAAEAAAAPNATEEQKKAAASFAKLATELKEGSTGSDYNQAALMMGRADAMVKGGVAGSADMYRESAALYEKFAAANKTSPDAPNALFNAAIAHDKAKDPRKAVAVREQLVKEYPEAKVIQQTYLILGANLASSREYAASAKYNQEYLARWPDSPQRCVAMQNLGVALQETKKPADAAAVYLKFAGDPVCGAEDPNTTARVLYSAAKMQADAKKPADARKTLQSLVALKGVTDAVAKSYQADAKDRLAKMK